MRKHKIRKRNRISFIKAEATGNDFILIDGRSRQNIGDVSKNLIKKLCDRNFGIGADGVVILRPPINKRQNDISWDFFNSDGSRAEMCGNASRCVGALLNRKVIRLETVAGIIKVIKNTSRNIYTCEFPYIKIIEKEIKIKIGREQVSGAYINTSVPHFVVSVKSLRNINKLFELAQKIKKNKIFGSHSTNVTFLILSKKLAQAITYERGVENFTKSCGTGAVAAGWVLRNKFGKDWNKKIKLSGGEVEVSLDSKICLKGPAQIVFRGEYGA